MCGICGFNWESEDLVRKMANVINHRGPDQEGYYCDASISLGHKRLSILDLSENGRQPMWDENNEVAIIYNGEIFNYVTLRNALKKKGYSFFSDTDTEVALKLYKEIGIDCVKQFNGQFAFCIYDKKKGLLFFARDRLGMKPLYYYCDKERIIFGSELKCLLESGIIKKEISKTALNHYLFLGHCPIDLSIIKNVRKLKPGHFMCFDLKKKEITFNKPFWKLSFAKSEKKSFEELKETTLESLEKSVKLRLISDRPLGAFLSGGLDSSIIVALMRKHVKDLKTFSISFDHPKYDEGAFARKVADHFKTIHTEIKFTSDDVKKFLPKMAYYFDEPFANSSVLPTLILAHESKKEVTVALSGTGGDELFYGYPRHRHYHFLRLLYTAPGFVKSIFFALAKIIKSDSQLYKAIEIIKNSEGLHQVYSRLFSFYRKDFLNIDLKFTERFKKYFTHGDVRDAFMFDQSEYLSGDLLYKDDIACLASSLEGRHPFLDHTFVEFANAIPKELKFKNGQQKYLLKKIAEKFLPKDLIYRRKRSFSVPFKEYLKKDLKKEVYNALFDFNDFEYYNKDELKYLWNEHMSGVADHSELFFTLLMFNLWYERWMKN
jgi:asparagine synthase (glutamine-hydrolysing)